MISCDVCGQNLLQSGNEEIYTCGASLQWVESYNKYIEFKHFACHFNNNLMTYKVINIYPYRFELFYYDKKTKISKIIVRSEIIRNGREAVYSSELTTVLEFDTIVEFPWNSRTEVIQKLKLYSILS